MHRLYIVTYATGNIFRFLSIGWSILTYVSVRAVHDTSMDALSSWRIGTQTWNKKIALAIRCRVLYVM